MRPAASPSTRLRPRSPRSSRRRTRAREHAAAERDVHQLRSDRQRHRHLPAVQRRSVRDRARHQHLRDRGQRRGRQLGRRPARGRHVLLARVVARRGRQPGRLELRAQLRARHGRPRRPDARRPAGADQRDAVAVGELLRPDAGDTGTVSFQVCSDSACTAVVQSGSSPSGIANGAERKLDRRRPGAGHLLLACARAGRGRQPVGLVGHAAVHARTRRRRPTRPSPPRRPTARGSTSRRRSARSTTTRAPSTGSLTFELCATSSCSSPLLINSGTDRQPRRRRDRQLDSVLPLRRALLLARPVHRLRRQHVRMVVGPQLHRRRDSARRAGALGRARHARAGDAGARRRASTTRTTRATRRGSTSRSAATRTARRS